MNRWGLLNLFVNMSLLVQAVANAGLIDLESSCSSFVLATKKIEVPGYPNAFNPSLVKWHGDYLLMFRVRDSLSQRVNQFGLVRLDSSFSPVGDVQIFMPRPYAQDPRFCEVGNRLYIVFNDNIRPKTSESPIDVRRMCISELRQRHNRYILTDPITLWDFPGENQNLPEKNWVPFEHNNELYLSYSINPHIVFDPMMRSGKCRLVNETRVGLNWKWGILRGGTQATHIDCSEYLAFFHSTKTMASVHSGGVMMPHYFIGAYTYQDEPPFRLNRISARPIVGKGFYHGEEYSTWKPLRVVFPMSYLLDDEHIYLTYGRQDHEMWIAILDRKALLESLIPVGEPHQ